MIKHIPNTLTCLNLTTGGIGAIFIIRGDYQLAIYFVLISALFDFFDGFAFNATVDFDSSAKRIEGRDPQ